MATKIQVPLKPKNKLSEQFLAKISQENQIASLKFFVVLTGIMILSAAAYVSLAVFWGKFSRAEVFFAECVREMLNADAIVTPLYHGTPFFDKPILSYWTIALSYKLFGTSHFTARIPSIVAALSCIFACGIGAKHLFGPRSGSLAAAALSSSFMFLYFANLCMADMTLVLLDTLSLSLLYLAVQNSRLRNSCFWLAALSVGLAFLTKGPVGIVLPTASFATYLTMTKQWPVLRFWQHVVPGTLIALLAASPWFLSAYKENGAGALSYFFIRENLERFAGSTYDTHKPLWFMLVSLFTGFLPWSIFLPFAAKKSWTAWRNDISSKASQNQLFLWLWIAVVIGFFSFSRGKIDYYALPAYPAAAMLVGNYLSEAIDQKERVPGIFAWFLAVALLGLGVSASFALPMVLGNSDVWRWVLLPSVLTSGGLMMLACIIKHDLRKAYKLVFVSTCLAAIAFALQVYPWISSKQAVLAYIPSIRSAAPETRIGVYSTLQNWIDEITFQTDREPLNIKNPSMAALFLESGAPVLLLMPADEFKKLPLKAQNKSRILDSREFIQKSVNPINLLSRAGKLDKTSQLLLLINRPASID